MSDTPRICCVRVSTSVSRVMGKRPCERPVRYTIDGKDYCARHKHVGDIAALRRELAEARALLDWSDEDQPLPEDAKILEAHPTRSGQHKTYAEALRMVGAKRSKRAIVWLVNWLLHRAEKAESILIQHYCDYEFTPTLEQAAEMMLKERDEKKTAESEARALKEE